MQTLGYFCIIFFICQPMDIHMDMRLSKRLLALSPLDGLIHSSLFFFLVLILLSIISSYIDKIH
jgi:hypothetical protein